MSKWKTVNIEILNQGIPFVSKFHIVSKDENTINGFVMVGYPNCIAQDGSDESIATLWIRPEENSESFGDERQMRFAQKVEGRHFLYPTVISFPEFPGFSLFSVLARKWQCHITLVRQEYLDEVYMTKDDKYDAKLITPPRGAIPKTGVGVR